MGSSKFEIENGVLRAASQGRADSYVMTSRTAAFYQQRLPRVARGVLADLGCGARPLKSFYDPFVERSIGVDWPASVHETSVDAFAHIQQGLPLRTGCIDTVLVSDVLEHLPEPGDFLTEANRVLRSGGCLIGNVPFLYWLHEEPHDYYRYTEFGIRHLLSRAGFSGIDVVATGGGGDIAVDLAGKFLWRGGRLGRRVSAPLQRTWLRVDPAVRRKRPDALLRLDRKFPLGYGFAAVKP